MKRSEVIKLIEREIQSGLGTDPDTGELLYPNGDYLGWKVLKALEEIGMKPPRISEEDCQAVMHVYIGGRFHIWDEELLKDEKVQAEKKRRAEWDAKSLEEKKAIRQSRREARSKRF